MPGKADKTPKEKPAPQTKFQQILLERNISQQQVADGTKLNKSQVSLIANGRQNMTVLVLAKLCIFLNCTPNDILPWELWLKTKEKKKKAA